MERNGDKNTLDELMDNMFNKEVFEMIGIIGCLGISLALEEQHNESSTKTCFGNSSRLWQREVNFRQADIEKSVIKSIQAYSAALIEREDLKLSVN